uniref:Putative ovule protein n=1 Tax=Solanum chacoense TaxID=4108 RepID=A0A0V0GSM1_SOLCH
MSYFWTLSGRINNPPGGLPSYKSYDTGAGFSKRPRSWVAKRALTLWSVGKPFKDRKPMSSLKSSSVKGSVALYPATSVVVYQSPTSV